MNTIQIHPVLPSTEPLVRLQSPVCFREAAEMLRAANGKGTEGRGCHASLRC